jgi:hypothetical protein
MLRGFLAFGCLLALATAAPGSAQAQDRLLTVAVLVNGSNTSAFNTNPSSPGEFQRFAERYLEHLQVPYELIDVSITAPPSDLASRQLIVAGHRGLAPSTAWRNAIIAAVSGGVGFVNLDSDTTIGSQSHIQAIFGATGSLAGTPATSITVPAAVRQGGAAAHFITALQRAFQGDTVTPTGDMVHAFHPDSAGVVQSIRSTVLTEAPGTVLARVGTDPLILATPAGEPRAVHFGTLDYLKADRFGFLMGVDDLFWRSLVWAARKPFVLRGYPRLWSVQMDDQEPGWGFRVRDMYDTSLTGTTNPDGTGGPWKVTGYLYMNNLPAGGEERASVVNDIQQSRLHVSPHSIAGVPYGNLYWDASSSAPVTDSQWLANLNSVMQWKQGLGGADAIPRFSRSMVPHFWDLSNNTGHDMWHTLGFRYVTSIQRPGFQNYADVAINGGAERLNARPFWAYEKPPKTVRDENYSLLFADDYVVGSRAGLPPVTFFLFTSQLQDTAEYPRADVIWPMAGFSTTESIEQFKRYTWRLWSSLATVQIYTHDSLNYALSFPADRREVISEVSDWLEQNGVRHVFMEDLGDYLYARNKSVLTDVRLVQNNLTYTFGGAATTADSVPIDTQVHVFFDDSESVPQPIQGFLTASSVTLPVPPPPPSITSVMPATGPVAGGTSITLTGHSFVGVTHVFVGDAPATDYVVHDSTSLSATTPAGMVGPADVTVLTSTWTATLLSGFTYIGPPSFSSIEPSFGPQEGGTPITIIGEGFEPTTTVRLGGAPATNVVVYDSRLLTAIAPAGPPGVAAIELANSTGTTTVDGVFIFLSGNDVVRLNFDHPTRDALLASGWDFLARTASGAERNTEQTSGLTASYDQALHPGVIRIPVDRGDVYQGVNNSRNTLFFDLPEGWRSVRLKIRAFQPAHDFQQVALLAYQDDDNYVLLGRYFNSALGDPQVVEFGSEAAGLYTAITRAPAPSNPVLFLRLDRNPASSAFSAFTSTDGLNWTALSGSIAKALANPRLAIVVGANESSTSIPDADIEFAEIVVVTGVPIIGVSPTSLTFATQSGTMSVPQSVTVSNTGEGVLNWTASASSSWLSVSPSSGTAPSTVAVTANAAGLAAGTHVSQITLASSTASNNPQSVLVTLTITPPAAPTLAAVSPATGPTAGGTPLTLTGTGFVAGTTVTLGGAPATDVVVASATVLTATTPAGLAGPADVVVANANGSAVLPDGFTYLAPGAVLLADDFADGVADGWLVSPLGNAGGWSVGSGMLTYAGTGHTQLYRGDPAWTDYTLAVDVRLASLSNYPGGIRGRVNPTTGAGYAVWLYPATGQLALFRATGWNIDSPGLVQLARVSGIPYVPGAFHRLALRFEGSQIEVAFDDAPVLTATDATYTSGVIALDVSNQPVTFDEVLVTGLP